MKTENDIHKPHLICRSSRTGEESAPNEGQVQGEAFSQCCLDTLELIARHATLFRDIVEGFKAKQGRIPTADEIIWCASQVVHHDITKEQ